MGLRELIQLKKEKKNTSSALYKRYLFIGEDFYTINLLNWFLEKYPNEEICLINSRKITKENLIFLGPGRIRGEDNIALWKKYLSDKFEDSTHELIEAAPLFYKDQDFRSFDGRHRSQEIKFDEQYFLGKSLRGQQQSVEKYYFDSIQEKITLKMDTINSSLKQTQVVSINKTSNSDFISPVNFEIELASGEVITCEHLFIGQGPYRFLELYKDKKSLSNEAIEFCEQVKPKHALLVRFYLAKKINDKEETLYIPFSVSNEIGHIIAEFNSAKEEKINNFFCKQYLDCYMSVDSEEVDEESVSRNIRLLRKNLERIFPPLEKNILKEFITLTEQIGCQKVDDSLYEKALPFFKNVYFLGENAPLDKKLNNEIEYEDSVCRASMLVRGILSGEQIQQLF